ncbi:MAG: hypothetical protein AVDCRST_MAG73-2176 [uncultured Thermomicrobiales bacterium]|uniref:Uncharacterized protein n=1 Tax=uncultured Thermomicrobiales bacterium TaxID=1645740 RepID=A0A6J4U851_9BACT|nr:MAG: hypothetical protein AVDCRST_MAG73-2176 [uncultured Thermomicrobiales bacterium]
MCPRPRRSEPRSRPRRRAPAATATAQRRSPSLSPTGTVLAWVAQASPDVPPRRRDGSRDRLPDDASPRPRTIETRPGVTLAPAYGHDNVYGRFNRAPSADGFRPVGAKVIRVPSEREPAFPRSAKRPLLYSAAIGGGRSNPAGWSRSRLTERRRRRPLARGLVR